MRNLNPLTKNEFEHFKDVINNEYLTSELKTRLKAIELYTQERYEEYKLKSPALSSISDSQIKDPETKKALQNCYERDRAQLTKEIFENQLAELIIHCPSCALGEPDCLDHYLPKGDYPEFSIFSLNLIPCCSSCNRKKSRIWIESGQRQFINFYYDDVERKQFLFCDITFRPSFDIHFSISNEYGIDQVTFNVIQNHFTKLMLLNRYNQKCIVKLGALLRNKSLDEDALQTLLKLNSENVEYTSGINNYEAVFYKALSKKTSEFMEYYYVTKRLEILEANASTA